MLSPKASPRSGPTEEPTTLDLVELTRQVVDAGSRHDADAVMGFCAPDAVWDMSDAGMGIFEGVAEIRGSIDDWYATSESHETEVLEMLDLVHRSRGGSVNHG